MNDIRKRTVKIMSIALKKEMDESSNPIRKETANWDSLTHVEFVLMLEAEFGVRFTVQEVNEMSSLDDVVQKIEGKNGS